jgi:hypothetical protein
MKLLANRPATVSVYTDEHLRDAPMTDPCLHLDLHTIAEHFFMGMVK